MDAAARDQLVMLVLVLVVVIIMGSGVVAALMAWWRNRERRERMVEKGRRLRAQFRGDVPAPPPAGAWEQSGQRFEDDADDTEVNPSSDDPPGDPDRS